MLVVDSAIPEWMLLNESINGFCHRERVGGVHSKVELSVVSILVLGTVRKSKNCPSRNRTYLRAYVEILIIKKRLFKVDSKNYCYTTQIKVLINFIHFRDEFF
jgi:hypothetical protein